MDSDQPNFPEEFVPPRTPDNQLLVCEHCGMPEETARKRLDRKVRCAACDRAFGSVSESPNIRHGTGWDV